MKINNRSLNSDEEVIYSTGKFNIKLIEVTLDQNGGLVLDYREFDNVDNKSTILSDQTTHRIQFTSDELKKMMKKITSN